MSYPDKQPMSWRGAPTTPGAKALALVAARSKVENAVHRLNLAKTDGELHVKGYDAEYRALSDAAAELVHAQAEWDKVKAAKADFGVAV